MVKFCLYGFQLVGMVDRMDEWGGEDIKTRTKLKLDGDVDTSHGNDKFVVALYDKRSYI